MDIDRPMDMDIDTDRHINIRHTYRYTYTEYSRIHTSEGWNTTLSSL